jgi:hypothetical protein
MRTAAATAHTGTARLDNGAAYDGYNAARDWLDENPGRSEAPTALVRAAALAARRPAPSFTAGWRSAESDARREAAAANPSTFGDED